ncbi:MAG: helix-turn-helix transcriptional regulator [Microthrixaceae bacterium]|nr:helix-turn-helix transcriptional regulator [Microthrixaceae bacterium]
MTQADVADRSGVARPNIVAYESGRREPLFRNALDLLGAAGAQVVVELPVVWSWTEGRRPYAVPSRLWRLPPSEALQRFEPGHHVWWSGPPRVFDLALRADRLRAYEIVLREGSPRDIEGVVDGVLLCEAWSDLVLPPSLRVAWSRLVLDPAESPTGRVAS